MSTIPLGELVQIRKGRKASALDSQPSAGALPYLQIDEVRGRKPTQFTRDANGVEVRPEDLCLIWDGANAGTVGFGREGLIGSTVARLRLREVDRWHTSFLGHLLQAQFNKLNSGARARGATIPHVNKLQLESIEIPLLDLSKQEYIASILDLADELNELANQQLLMLQKTQLSLFSRRFGAETYPHIQLGEIISVSSGSGLIAADQRGGPYPVFGGNGINGWHDEYTVPGGVIVIGRVGVYCGAVHVTPGPSWVTDNALMVTKKDDSLRTRYLADAISNANLNQYAGRSAQPLVSGTRIYPVSIPYPPEDVQLEYEREIEVFLGVTNALDTRCAKFKALRTALQHRAFHGEL